MKTGLIKVRIMPRTGLGKRKRANEGAIYLKGDWLGKKVVCVDGQEWHQITSKLRKYRKSMRTIIKATNIFL